MQKTLTFEPVLMTLRQRQRQMATWSSGELAVAAVPGSGKSTGIASAAAIAIARNEVSHSRQLVVVTFTRSAAANLKTKIRQQLQQLQLLPVGFTVQTLHGLALQLARRHPDLAQLNLRDSALISPHKNHRLLRAAVDQWILQTPDLYNLLLEGQYFDGEETERLRRQSVLRTDVLPSLAATVIQEAKSSGLGPDDLRQLALQPSQVLTPHQVDYPTLTIAAGLYEQYQQQLQQRDLLDYHDMILAALRVLKNPEACLYWQQRIVAIFEDEAQDSSPLQSQLLQMLAYDPETQMTHLVRVGDANQAINTTFTPADPIFFQQFCQRCAKQQQLVAMDQAGRSTSVIMQAANFLLTWVNTAANLAAQSGLPQQPPFQMQLIKPVPIGDPQPNANPPALGLGLEIQTPSDIHGTLQRLGERVRQLWQADRHLQAAVLVRENRQGTYVAQYFQHLNIEGLSIYEVGQQQRHAHVPVELLTLLRFLHRPHSPQYLKQALKVLSNRRLIPPQDLDRLAIAPEAFLYPVPSSGPRSDQATEAQDAIGQARRLCTQLLRAPRELPLPDLMAFLGFSLGYDQTELATADKLADRLLQQRHEWASLEGLINALTEVVNSEQFEAVDPDATESRYTQSGQLTIITMHKAKGLDWDVVFVPFLQDSTIPGNLWVSPQAEFLGNFSLAEVSRAQIRHSLHQLTKSGNIPSTSEAWQQAHQLKLAEEYRLLYVAMTRAKRLLWLAAAQKAPFSWGKPENLTNRQPCPVIPALKAHFPEAVR